MNVSSEEEVAFFHHFSEHFSYKNELLTFCPHSPTRDGKLQLEVENFTKLLVNVKEIEKQRNKRGQKKCNPTAAGAITFRLLLKK